MGTNSKEWVSSRGLKSALQCVNMYRYEARPKNSPLIFLPSKRVCEDKMCEGNLDKFPLFFGIGSLCLGTFDYGGGIVHEANRMGKVLSFMAIRKAHLAALRHDFVHFVRTLLSIISGCLFVQIYIFEMIVQVKGTLAWYKALFSCQ